MAEEFKPTETEASAETALEGWKDIAAHLNRAVRTVKRWEKDEGLPVRRHQHQARASVYAYPSELEAWKAGRDFSLDAPEAITWLRPLPRLAMVAVLALALFNVGSGPILHASSVAAAEGMSTEELWTEPGVDVEGQVAPDGSYLSFVDWSTGDLAVHDLATGENRRLTHKGSWEDSSQFAELSVPSPDARGVLYAWFNGKTYDLRVIGADGSAPHVVYSDPGVNYFAPGGWSADQKMVSAVACRPDGTKQILLIPLDGSPVHTLKTIQGPLPTVGPFSADGRYLLYDLPPDKGSYQRDIFLLALDGSRETRLVKHPADDRPLGWAPDGSGLLFTSDRTGSTGIWLLPMSEDQPAGPPQPLKQNLGQIFPLALTRQGALYYGQFKAIRDAYRVAVDPVTGRVAQGPGPLSDGFVGANRRPAYSPDGKYLAYLSYRERPEPFGTPTVVIRTRATGVERSLQPGLQFQHPQWSPLTWSAEGRWLFAAADGNPGPRGIYQIDVESGAARLLVRSGRATQVADPVISPDGQFLYYRLATGSGDPPRILRRNLETGKEVEVFRGAPGPSFFLFSLSPDGKQLALPYSDEKAGFQSLRLVPVDGGKVRDMARTPFSAPSHYAPWAGVQWTPDGHSLLFSRWQNYPKPKQDLLLVPMDGGEPHPVGLEADLPIALALDPAGRELAFTAGDPELAVWALRNFLPATKAEARSK